MNPITGIADCCARAASGHEAETIIALMKSRRRIACPKAQDYDCQLRLHQGLATGGMGFNDKFAVLVGFPLAFRGHRLARRGSDKRSSRSSPDMGVPSPPIDFLLEKKIEPSHHRAAEIFCQEEIFPESGIHICIDYTQIRAR